MFLQIEFEIWYQAAGVTDAVCGALAPSSGQFEPALRLWLVHRRTREQAEFIIHFCLYVYAKKKYEPSQLYSCALVQILSVTETREREKIKESNMGSLLSFSTRRGCCSLTHEAAV